MYLKERGNPVGFRVVMGFLKTYSLVLRMPLGERMLTRLGRRGLKKRYAGFGSVAENHNYGVSVQSQEDIKQSMIQQEQNVGIKEVA